MGFLLANTRVGGKLFSQEVANRNPITSLERKRVRGFDAEQEWIQERVPTTGAQVRLRKIMSSDTGNISFKDSRFTNNFHLLETNGGVTD